MKRLLQRAAITGLGGAYIILTVISSRPNVSDEYRAYYIAKSNSDWKSGYYTAMLEEGIDMRKEGLPSHVRYLGGVSQREWWGRWTDAKVGQGIRVEFYHSFFGDVCIRLKAKPSVSQQGKRVELAFGTAREIIRTELPRMATYSRTMHLSHPGNVLVIKPEAPSPAKWEPRRQRFMQVGLAVENITVLPRACPEDMVRRVPNQYKQVRLVSR